MKPTILNLTLLAAFLAFPSDAHTQETSGDQPSQPDLSVESSVIVSETQGVDFKPYLARVGPFVRNNWFAEIPELARSGRESRVVIEFKILRDGSVPQVRVAESSGFESLDHTAMEAIRASVPLPPLPSEFTGDHVVIQLPFLYKPAKGGASEEAELGPNKATENYVKPSAIYRPFPEYTGEARKAKLEGVVFVRYTVNTDGKTADIQVTKSLGMGLDEKAVEVVGRWKFHPALRDGLPVPVQMIAGFHFRLDNRTAQVDEQVLAEAGAAPRKPAPEPEAQMERTARHSGISGAEPAAIGNMTAPVLLSRNIPGYTEEARHARLEGTVVLWIVVDAKGDVSDASVKKGLGMGLDEKAVEAVRAWKFKPAMREGVAVPVRILVEVAFLLR